MFRMELMIGVLDVLVTGLSMADAGRRVDYHR